MDLNSYSPLYFFLANKAARAKVVKDFKEASTEHLYDHVLNIQTQVTSRNDFLFFSGQSAWDKAKSVVDLGCAGGHYLNFLSQFFPQKQFVGVDIDEGFIELARERFSKRGTFICTDACDFNISKFNYVIVRAVLQHLTDEQYSTLVQSLEKWIKPSTRIAFFDHNPHFTPAYDPPIPAIAHIHRMIAKWQKKKGGDRSRLENFIKSCANSGFEIEMHEKPRYDCKNEFDKDLFARYELAKAAIISKRFDIKIDLSRVAKDISDWLNTPHSHAIQGCGQWVVVKKKK